MTASITRCLRCLLLIAPLLLGACVQDAFYYPDRVLYGTPADAGLAYEDLTFNSSDGTLLSGWFIPAVGIADSKQAKGTVIHFHGNAQNMSAHWEFVSWLPRRGFNVFVFDYRGYGKSAGRPEPQGLFADSNSALNYLRNRKDIDPERLFVFGQSLGGTNAIAAVGSGNRNGIKAVAIEATFYSYTSIANDKVPGSGLLMDNRYSASNFVARIAPIPLLLIHGDSDPVIPHAHSLRLLADAQVPKTLVTVTDGGHIEALTPRFGRRYQDTLLDFFEQSLRSH